VLADRLSSVLGLSAEKIHSHGNILLTIRHTCPITDCMKTYTTVQLAERLAVGRDTIYRWMRAGKIKTAPVSRLGPFRVRLWTEHDVARIRKFMEEGYFEGRGRRKSREGGAK